MSKDFKSRDDAPGGPFRVPESQFPPSEPPREADFTDADVEAAMADEAGRYVTEGAPPPLPTPPGGASSWATVNPVDRSAGTPRRTGNTAVPEDEDDDSESDGVPGYINKSQAPPASKSVVDTGGLVVEIGATVQAPEEEEPSSDLGSTTMTYAAIGIVAALLGMAGAAIIAVVLLQVQPSTELEASKVTVVPTEEASKVPVRRDLKAPPKPEKVLVEPVDEDLNEVPSGDREVVGEIIEDKPQEEVAPIRGRLPD